jgi:hypothetical protein
MEYLDIIGTVCAHSEHLSIKMGCLLILENTVQYVLPILGFPSFDPLTESGMALSVNLGPKCQNLFPLV